MHNELLLLECLISIISGYIYLILLLQRYFLTEQLHVASFDSFLFLYSVMKTQVYMEIVPQRKVAVI